MVLFYPSNKLIVAGTTGFVYCFRPSNIFCNSVFINNIALKTLTKSDKCHLYLFWVNNIKYFVINITISAIQIWICTALALFPINVFIFKFFLYPRKMFRFFSPLYTTQISLLLSNQNYLLGALTCNFYFSYILL